MEPRPSVMFSTANAGATAASLLENTCRSALESRGSLQLEVVRDLAKDLRLSLEAVTRTTGKPASAHLLVEAALWCADLANLAACNVGELPGRHKPPAVAAVHLATGAARALSVLAESTARELEPSQSDNVLRDARGASWRVDLAIRQVEELPETGTRANS